MPQTKKDIWVDNPTGLIKKGTLCPNCARYNARNVAVSAVVFNQNKVLLVKRAHNPMKDYWALPGGYLDWDETLEEAVVRELKEETNLDGSVIRLIGAYSATNRDEDGRQSVGIAYELEVIGDLKAGDDAAKVEWFEFDKLPPKIAFDHLHILQQAIAIYTNTN